MARKKTYGYKKKTRLYIRNCQVCRKSCRWFKLYVTQTPLTYIIDDFGGKKTYPKGTILCDNELKKLSTEVYGTTSSGQNISYYDMAWRRDDGEIIIK